MTICAGMSGLTREGLSPRAFTASRMVARSTMQGTPVKSCMSTRAGLYWISLSGWALGSQSSSWSSWSRVTVVPFWCRSRFSARMRRL